MDAMLTLYILAGCVALAVLVFIVMGVATMFRAPRLPDLASLDPAPARPFARAHTPRPFPLPAGIIALQPMPGTDASALTNDHSAPRTVIPLPPIAGIAPATRARSSPGVATAMLVAAHADRRSAAAPQLIATQAAARGVVAPISGGNAPIVAPIAAHAASQPLDAWSVPVSRPAPMPVATHMPLAMPPLVAPPVAPARMPRATMQPITTAAPARMPRTTMQPIPSVVVASDADWSTGPGVAVVRRDETTLPILRQRPSLLGAVLGWTIATLLVAAAPAVVEPSLLDPLCDDYEWDGAEAAAIVRDYAREANIAIDLDPFAITKVDSNVRPVP